MGEVAKGKGKTRGKMEKPENVLRSKKTNRHKAFQLRFEVIINVLVSRLISTYIKKRKLRF